MDFREIKEFFMDALKYIIVIAVVFILSLYVVTFSTVSGNSMEPTYSEGEVMLLNKLAYKFGDVERYDIVVLSDEGVRNLIKRVVGLPGETIEYKDNILYIDGEPYDETVIYEEIETADFKLEDLPGNYEVIPEDMYLVLGDNRGDSYDSRDMGLIPIDQIEGELFLSVWPLNKFGSIK